MTLDEVTKIVEGDEDYTNERISMEKEKKKVYILTECYKDS